MQFFSTLWKKMCKMVRDWRFERLHKERRLAIMNYRAVQTSQYWGRKMRIVNYVQDQYYISTKGIIYLGIVVILSIVLATIAIGGNWMLSMGYTEERMLYMYISAVCAFGILVALILLGTDTSKPSTVSNTYTPISAFTDDELIGELERRHPDCVNKGD